VTGDAGELGLTRLGLPLLRDLIGARTGLSYDDGREDTLAERLASLVIDRGFRSYLDLFYLLKYEDSESDWARVMDALSVQETYFWREIDQVRAVVDQIVPSLAARRPGGVIRIWSVPCATGEEPLSIAMLLDEAGWFSRQSFEIHAGDASPLAIARARQAVYRERSFRALPEALRLRYFRPVPGGMSPSPDLQARISSWSVMNLMDPRSMMAVAGAPIVFCRNAFIYFSPAAVRQVVQTIADAMPSPGYLCIGAAESLLSITTAFTLQEIGGAFVYVKR
jgi:chemotaxis protein methyltransferase CheR